MPTQRQIVAAQRRVARERFMKARIVEREFGIQLANCGRQVGQIIKGFERDGKITDMAALKQSLDAYSKTLEPWAKAIVARMQAQVSRRDLTAWKQLSQSIGSNLHRMIEDAPIGFTLRQMLDETTILITSLPTEAAERVHVLTLEGITMGRRAEDIKNDILNSGHVTVSRARLIARTEVARTASVLTEVRAQYVGSTQYRWMTSRDAAVRQEHRIHEGKVFDWTNPPVAGFGKHGVPIHANAGQIWNCRCWSDPLIPDVD
jgi:SPP1 gp7 family putative phage head morphogenesis protein